MSYAPVLPTPVPVSAPAPPRSAPPVVHVVAVLQYLGGVAALAVGGLFAYLTAVVLRDPGTPDDFIDPTTLGIAFAVLAGFSFGSGGLGILLGRTLQRGRPWARVVLLMLSGLAIVVVTGSIVIHSAHWTCSVFAVYPALCIALLNTRAARTWSR